MLTVNIPTTCMMVCKLKGQLPVPIVQSGLCWMITISLLNQKYLRYLDSLEKSPNTIRGLRQQLEAVLGVSGDKHLDWKEVSLEQMSDFIHWLKKDPYPSTHRCLSGQKRRLTMPLQLFVVLGLTSVRGNWRRKCLPLSDATKYKPFLHHISKARKLLGYLRLKSLKHFQDV